MVNVFSPSVCPIASARAIDSKRLSRMCYEAYEVLSSALLHHSSIPELKPFRKRVYHASKGHLNHPAAKWAAEDRLHFEWLLQHAAELNEQYILRYKKTEPCAPYQKVHKVLSKAVQYIPDGQYDHDDITSIEFCDVYSRNEFRREYSSAHAGEVKLPEHTSTQTRYRLYLLYKWLYEDVRDVSWSGKNPPVWAYNPLYREWLRKTFGKPTKKPAELNVKGGLFVTSLATQSHVLNLTNVGGILNNRYKGVLKHHTNDAGTVSCAFFSKDKIYRYYLSRQWSTALPLVVIMLNPSTANEFKNDPTVARVETIAKNAGYGGYIVLNMAAYRATDPKDMLSQHDPVGPLNAKVIRTTLGQVVGRWRQKPQILLAYGNNIERIQRKVDYDRTLHDIMRSCNRYGKLVQLQGTKKGHPQHPLYIASGKSFERYLPW